MIFLLLIMYESSHTEIMSIGNKLRLYITCWGQKKGKRIWALPQVDLQASIKPHSCPPTLGTTLIELDGQVHTNQWVPEFHNHDERCWPREGYFGCTLPVSQEHFSPDEAVIEHVCVA